MPHVIQLAHGYPPREIAGTEVYTSRVAREMLARGWRVNVIAATRSPGRRHGSTFFETVDSVPVHRVVNNLPWRPLGQAEQDPLIEQRIEHILRDLKPDVIHVQHLLFLSAHLELPCPSLATLHDAWAWCPRGGTLLRNGATPCPGPEVEACASCYQDWAQGSNWEHTLARIAGILGRAIDPDRLHELWRHLPPNLRSLPRQGPPLPAATSAQFETRQKAVLTAFQSMNMIVAPSRWLAEQAADQGLARVVHLPHGVGSGPRSAGDGPFLFLGSLVPHKGAHLVAKAHAMALERNPTLPRLDIVGPPVDPDYAETLPNAQPPIPPKEVPRRLSDSRALVLGSIWPENSPLVVLEARAAGCPIIAPDIGGLSELIEHGVDGLLYPPGDSIALSHALEESFHRSWEQVRPPPTLQSHMDQLESLYQEVTRLL